MTAETPQDIACHEINVFNKSTADLIIRSSDGIDFRVHKAILAEASSVFEAMFSLPPNTDSKDDVLDLPVVTLSEDGKTLAGLLRVCYPNVGLPVDTHSGYRELLTVAEKYNMEGTVERLKVLVRLEMKEVMDEEPVRAYAIARLYDFKDEARKAARKSLLCPMIGSPVGELKLLSAYDYHELLAYRQRCMQVLDPLLKDCHNVFSRGQGDIRPGWTTCLQGCRVPGNPELFVSSSWVSSYFINHLSAIKSAFVHRTSGSTATSLDIITATLISIRDCSSCAKHAPVEIVNFSKQLAIEIEQAISQIPIPPYE